MRFFSFILFFFAFQFAAAEPLPAVCGAVRCTEKMVAIENGLYAGTHVEREDLPAVYSGECYYHSPNYDPNTTHYGLVLLETRDSQIFFNGIFRFFSPQNPWADWTIEDARNRIGNTFRYPVAEFANYSFVDLSHDGANSIWKYWMSQDPQTKSVYLVFFWGYWQQGFCELKMHGR